MDASPPPPDCPASPSLVRSVMTGSLGFTWVSLAGFSLWAFGGRWFYRTVGEAGLYAATALVFLGLAGLALAPLLGGPRRLARVYALFIPGFFLYAIAWCVCWFALGFGWGEWLGSAVGSLLFAGWICGRLGHPGAIAPAGVVLFVTHSAGYFLGGLLMAWMMKPETAGLLSALNRDQIGTLAKLGWGLLYGLGFGLGLGFTFFAAQRRVRPVA